MLDDSNNLETPPPNNGGNYENNQNEQLKAFGAELDQIDAEIPSVNLNSQEGKAASGKHQVCSSPTKQSKGKISSFLDQNDLSGSRDA